MRFLVIAVLLVACKRSSNAPQRIKAKCAQPCDVTSAASIDYALNAIREPPQPANGCVERRLDNRLVKLGTKSGPGGASCAFDRVLANCCLFTPKDDRGVLDALGWATMTPQLREELVPGFVWAMYDRVGITDAPASFGTHVFTPPVVDTLPDGSVEYIAWWSKVNGDAIAYTRTSWVITTDAVIEATDAETFVVPIKDGAR